MEDDDRVKEDKENGEFVFFFILLLISQTEHEKACFCCLKAASFSHVASNGVPDEQDTPNNGMYVRAHHYPISCTDSQRCSEDRRKSLFVHIVGRQIRL